MCTVPGFPLFTVQLITLTMTIKGHLQISFLTTESTKKLLSVLSIANSQVQYQTGVNAVPTL